MVDASGAGIGETLDQYGAGGEETFRGSPNDRRKTGTDSAG